MNATASVVVDDRGPKTLAETEVGPFIDALAPLHRVLCPRQVLGIRMALMAQHWLGVPFPQVDKRTVIVPEIDGCFVDGLMVVSGCSVGHRTMRVRDYGKIAATVADTVQQRAIRLWPRPRVRQAARAFAPSARSRWHAQRLGYASMPATDLFAIQELPIPPEIMADVGRRTTARVACARCGEEVFNGRQVRKANLEFCRACAAHENDDD
jgi:formylmethanofuran dehydrogenase subunit E